MKEISFNSIIRQVVLNNDFANPLYDDFDLDQLVKSCRELVSKYEHAQVKVIDIDKGDITLGVITELNQIYEELILQIEDTINTINLDKDLLIQEILTFINYQFFSGNALMHQNLLDKSALPKHIEDKSLGKVKNIWGETVNLQHGQELSVDTFNTISNIIISFSPIYNDKPPKLSDQELKNKISELFFLGNILANIECSFDYYKYEFGELSRLDNGDIIFKHIPEQYYSIRTIGIHRNESLSIEASLYASNMGVKDETQGISLSVEDGLMKIHVDEVKKETQKLSKTVLSVRHYYYLHHIKFPNLDKGNIHDIVNIICELKSLFDHFNSVDIIEDVIKNQTLNNIPIKIYKRKLIEYLSTVTKVKTNIVAKVLSKISRPLNIECDIWKYPLINKADYYLFLLTPLAHANPTYLIENIIKNQISESTRLSLFTASIRSEIKEEKLKFPFNLINKSLSKSLSIDKNILIYEMQDRIILIAVQLTYHPIHSREYNHLLEIIGNTSLVLNDYRARINEIVKNKEVCSIILTDYPFLSSLYINDCHLVDTELLKNYIITGEFKSGIVISNHGETESHTLSSYVYYKNESEFNDNFISFLLNPTPITDRIIKYIPKNYKITPPDTPISIYEEGLEFLDSRDMIKDNINLIHRNIQSLYYFESSLNKNIEAQKVLEGEIMYHLPTIINSILFEKDRKIRVNLLGLLKSGETRIIPYLMQILYNAAIEVSSKKIVKTVNRVSREYNGRLIVDFIEKLLSDNNQTDMQILNLNIRSTPDLNEEFISDIIEFLIDSLSEINQRSLLEKDFNQQILSLSLLYHFAFSKEEYKKEIYFATLNFIDALNFNNYHQKARDVCETILEISLKRENVPVLGWYCFFRCNTKQHNIYEALFYGNLLFSSLISSSHIEDFLIFDAYLDLMTFYRNFRIQQYVENIYNAMKGLELIDYDRHRLTLTYYNSMIQNDFDSIESHLLEIYNFLEENIDSIKKYEEKGVMPWIAFIYNLNNLSEHNIISDSSRFKPILISLQEVISQAVIKDLEAKYFSIGEETKKNYINALYRVFETRDYEDLSSELSLLLLQTKNIVNLSIEPIDINYLLLSGLVLNDNSIAFKPIIKDGDFIPFFSENFYKNTQTYIDNYSRDLIDKLKLKKNQILIWLFEIDGEVFSLRIKPDKSYSLLREEWNYNKMKEWLSNISKFYFDDKRGVSINEQEDEYKKILDETIFSRISGLIDYEEILLYSSIELAEFPHNLLQISVKENQLENHEYSIKEYLKIDLFDFLGFHKKIINILSLDWFVNNLDDIVIKKDNLTFESWIPIEDNDFVLEASYSKLRPIIKDGYNGKIYTNIIPPNPLQGIINIFVAHGGKGKDGFRTIYTRNNDGIAFLKNEGVDQVLGKGKIAILLICHSASISKNLFYQKINTFTQKVFSLGYNAVIAPAWGLNYDINPVWLPAFLDSFVQNGKSLIEAVYNANLTVAKSGYNEYHGFYTPSGWAAMHLYGNPNIYIEN